MQTVVANGWLVSDLSLSELHTTGERLGVFILRQSELLQQFLVSWSPEAENVLTNREEKIEIIY